FFSSRRRHTRFSRDWSSDVCSSDLLPAVLARFVLGTRTQSSRYQHVKRVRSTRSRVLPMPCSYGLLAYWIAQLHELLSASVVLRSEERRVGKEGRIRWMALMERKKD